MTLTLTHCRNTHPTASDAELRELARRLERGDYGYGNSLVPVNVEFGSREAAVCIDTLRRAAGDGRG